MILSRNRHRRESDQRRERLNFYHSLITVEDNEAVSHAPWIVRIYEQPHVAEERGMRHATAERGR